MKAVSIKELIKKVLAFGTISTAVPTKTNSNVWKSGTIILYRRSGLVTVKFNAVVLGTISARTDFAIIPEGYRPITETGGILDSSNLWFFCRPNGTLAINPVTASTTVWGAVTYMIPGGGYCLKAVFSRLSAVLHHLKGRWRHESIERKRAVVEDRSTAIDHRGILQCIMDSFIEHIGHGYANGFRDSTGRALLSQYLRASVKYNGPCGWTLCKRFRFGALLSSSGIFANHYDCGVFHYGDPQRPFGNINGVQFQLSAARSLKSSPYRITISERLTIKSQG